MDQIPLNDILSSHLISVPPETPVSEAIAIMQQKNISCILILEDNKPEGIFTERSIVSLMVKKGEDFRRCAIREVMSQPVHTATGDTDVYTAYNILLTYKIRHLVVVDNRGLAKGVVTQSDLIDHLGYEYFVEIKKITQIMSKKLVTVSGQTTLDEALQRMDGAQVSCIVALKQNRPIGILTERDCARRLIHEDKKNLLTIQVRDIMSSPVVTVNLETPVHDAAQLMRSKGIRRLVVVDQDNQIVGITTQSDIVRGLEARYIETLKSVIKSKDIKLNRTMQDLTEKSLYLDNILRSSIDLGIVATDLNFNVAYYNPTAEQILGIPYDDIIGRDAKDIHVLENVDMFKTDQSGKLKCQNTWKRFHLGDERDRNFYLQAKVSEIWDTDESVMGYVLMIRDITERKRIEEELVKIKKMESISTLAGGIAHDFNNLLTAILGNISLAQVYVEPEDRTKELMEAAERACIRAKELTHHLITFAKGGEPAKQTMRLQDVLPSAVDFCLSGSNVKSVISLPDNLHAVDFDPGHVRQMVNTIITNAMEAMPDGGVVKIQGENVHIEEEGKLPIEPGKYVHLIFQDQGSGIATENLPRIFDPYFSTKERGTQKGMGLGLTIAYSIIDRHHGYVLAESQVNQGTVIHIYLPASSGLKKTESREKIDAPLSKKEKGKILVMDDEELVRDVVEEMLEYMNYTVELAADGQEAIDRYKKALNNDPFDLVILDLTVPAGMGGQETIQHLKEIDPSVSAVVSSGYSNDPVMADFRGHGFIGAIPKPYDMRKMRSILESFFKTE